MVRRPQNKFERYHAHVYFDEHAAGQARELCTRAGAALAIEVGRFHEQPVGPHPLGSCQLSFDSTQFDRVIGWLEKNRGGLTVFVHGLSGNDYEDHTTNATWLGEPAELELSIFE